MDEIIKDLKQIINDQLKDCVENKKVPSKEVLDTIGCLRSLEY